MKNEKQGVGSSPGWAPIAVKLTVRLSIRGGVPVFKRATLKGSARSFCAKALAGWSPARPP